MARLPVPGGDVGTWGVVLNDYLAVSHNSDGSLKINPEVTSNKVAIISSANTDTQYPTAKAVYSKVNSITTDDITDTASKRYTNDTDISRLANTSGTNTGDQDISDLLSVITHDETLSGSGTSSSPLCVVSTKSGQIDNISVKTGDYVLSAQDELIVCNKATALSISLPAATGSGQTFNIKNIGVGVVVIDGNDSDTIDGELTQQLSQYDNLLICDYDNNKWVIL